MKNLNDIKFIMNKLNCTEAEINQLSDDAFEITVQIVKNGQPKLSQKEIEFGMEVAKKLEQGLYRF